MEAIPAGPACPVPRRPSLAVVVPVHNGGPDLEHGLRGLRASGRDDFELIVVDDGSTDQSAAVARRYGARVVTRAAAGGPAAARNLGVAASSAPLIVFLDADVVAHPDTLERTIAHFQRDPGLSALFGSYDDAPSAPGLVSAYRNLLHHFTHQQGRFTDDARPAGTFWTGCGAIRREAFLALGGFDTARYRRPAIEDIEFGYRLTAAGHRIALARDVLVTHRKRWTLGSVVKTDILQRGVPWALLLMRTRRRESDLNVSPAQRCSVALTGLGLPAVLGVVLDLRLGVIGALALGALAWLNFPFYRFLARRRGWAFAVAAFPLHLLYFVCCGVSVLIALALRGLQREPSPVPRSDGPAARAAPARWAFATAPESTTP